MDLENICPQERMQFTKLYTELILIIKMAEILILKIEIKYFMQKQNYKDSFIEKLRK